MQQSDSTSRLDRIYSAIVRDEDARVCTDISDDACQYVPRNFFLIAISHCLTSLGDHLANAKTVLVWLLGFVGAPAALVALLVPIRESGSLVPQLFIAGFIRQLAHRKGVWVVGSLLQAAALAGMGVVAATTGGIVAGWLILALLVVFSLARGLCSVASKDVMGKTVPKTRRGRLTGLSTAVSGTAAIVFGAMIWLIDDDTESPRFYMGLLFGAASLWFIAGLVYVMIREFAGETEGGANAFAEAIARLSILRTDAGFRRFVITRALFLCSALSAPYYVVLAQERHGIDLKTLGLFILANALASSLSAAFWGIMADVSSKRVLILAAALAAILGIIVFAINMFATPLSRRPWIYPAAFFVLGIAHSGVRLGRKTYVIDMASGNRRTDYVAVGNTVIGLILLLTGLSAPLVSVLAPAGVILLLSLCGLTGVVIAFTLPEVEQDHARFKSPDMRPSS